MMMRCLLAAAISLAFAQASAAQVRSAEAVPVGLVAARDLYASASYAEALAVLSTIEGADAEQADQYRALCLMALGRTTEAERVLEHSVVRNPLYRMSDQDVSPRLVAMFREARQRTLPTAARDLYAKGKGKYDSKEYPEATVHLTQLLTILADDDMAAHAEGLNDFKVLAEGFLQLMAAAAPPVATTAAAAPQVAAVLPAAKPIYSANDPDVTAPVSIRRDLPAWAPNAAMRDLEYRGVVELLIDARGVVETAVVRESVSPFYDATLVTAARQWTFRPATRGGQPVRYFALFAIVLNRGE